LGEWLGYLKRGITSGREEGIDNVTAGDMPDPFFGGSGLGSKNGFTWANGLDVFRPGLTILLSQHLVSVRQTVPPGTL
jgi:hypothetical protein